MKGLKRLSRFLKEENGQATLEYLLVLGSAMVAGAMIASSYYKITYNTGENYEGSIRTITNTTCDYVETAFETGLGADFDFCTF